MSAVSFASFGGAQAPQLRVPLSDEQPAAAAVAQASAAIAFGIDAVGAIKVMVLALCVAARVQRCWQMLRWLAVVLVGIAVAQLATSIQAWSASQATLMDSLSDSWADATLTMPTVVVEIQDAFECCGFAGPLDRPLAWVDGATTHCAPPVLSVHPPATSAVTALERALASLGRIDADAADAVLAAAVDADTDIAPLSPHFLDDAAADAASADEIGDAAEDPADAVPGCAAALADIFGDRLARMQLAVVAVRGAQLVCVLVVAVFAFWCSLRGERADADRARRAEAYTRAAKECGGEDMCVVAWPDKSLAKGVRLDPVHAALGSTAAAVPPTSRASIGARIRGLCSGISIRFALAVGALKTSIRNVFPPAQP
ncbi:hypothetical protein HK105_207812 [Polyrhizophydium stewartii]|uniref:Uncharacterized protein n=1 Tax=Polyrhizophydium stewartii TaxID=2732419 RepID=A0ABR4MZP2_9FUNG